MIQTIPISILWSPSRIYIFYQIVVIVHVKIVLTNYGRTKLIHEIAAKSEINQD